MWTEERVALLSELNPLGTSSWMAAEINARTGSSFSRNAVIGKLHRIGLVKAIVPGVVRPKRTRGTSRHLNNVLNRQFVAVEQKPKRPDHLGLSLVQLKKDFSQCRYIDGDNETTPYTFCAQPVTEDSSYCGYHHHLCCKPYEKQKAA